MRKRPIRLFLLILVLSVVMAAFSLPERVPLRFSAFGVTVDRELSPPVIDLRIGNLRLFKKFTTQLGLDLSGGSEIIFRADMSGVSDAERATALDSVSQVIERRINFFGVSEPVVQTSRMDDEYRVIVEMPGVNDAQAAIGIIGQTAKLEFREFKEASESSEAAALIPTMENTSATDLTGRDLKRAYLSYSQETGEPQVAIEFTGEGAEKFRLLTERLVGEPLPVFLDELPLTWPTVTNSIPDGSAVITGNFSREGAKLLALQLNAGALPVPVEVISQRVIGASLGQDSVNRSIRAGFIGLGVVMVFMVLYYGWLGLFADMALLVYGIISYFIFRLVPITLTLPGITGFILSIGMAVDSNILIFERFKEELRAGRPWQTALELGFGRAWESIKDANITTILTCAILYNPGNWQFLPSSGMLRGFAATLFIGVLVSLFSGIVVTRTFLRVLYRGHSKGQLSLAKQIPKA